jgi:ABC-type glutathione transport system ATPase component
LLLDEVLAVGDEAFQKKSLSVFEKYIETGKTVVLVTHDMGVVNKYCTDAIFLKDGVLQVQDKPSRVSKIYSDANNEAFEAELQKRPTLIAQKISVDLYGEDGNKRRTFRYGEIAQLRIDINNSEIKNVGVALLTATGQYIFGTNTIIDAYGVANKVSYNLQLNVGLGNYNFTIGLFGDTESDALSFIEDVCPFQVVPGDEPELWGGLTKLPHNWE